MRLTKAQKRVIDEIHNGGHIWYVGDFPYLAVIDENNRVKSESIKKSLAQRLKNLGLITRVEGENTWITS